MKSYLFGAAALTLGFLSTSAAAHCDKITGGGWIVTQGYPLHDPFTHAPAKGTFGAAGGCKHAEYWGHLEYHDHGNGLNVHWLTITHYHQFGDPDVGAENDPKRTGRRLTCGTARTNLYGNVNFVMDMWDKGEPGTEDVFRLRLTHPTTGTIVYSTECDANHTLGGIGSGGGNLQLHKPNDSTRAFPPSGSCPARDVLAPTCANGP
jgi:hypothetical protein